jgi:hypothetical protein
LPLCSLREDFPVSLPVPPIELEEGAAVSKKMIFAEEVKKYVKRNRSLQSNFATIYELYGVKIVRT